MTTTLARPAQEKKDCRRGTCDNAASKGYGGYCQKHAYAKGIVHHRIPAGRALDLINDMLDRGETVTGIVRLSGVGHESIYRLLRGEGKAVRASTFQRLQQAASKADRQASYAPADEARSILQTILDRDIAFGTIERLVGLGATGARRIHDGTTEIVTPDTLAKLRQTDELTAPRPAWPIIRRIRALRAIGHRIPDIAAGAGVPPREVSRLSEDTPPESTPAYIDQAIRAHYARHEGDPAQPADHRIRRKNWPKPMDWTDIDNPSEDPRQATSRAGLYQHLAITDEHREAAQVIIAHHGSPTAGARVIGIKPADLKEMGDGTATTASRQRLQKVMDHCADILAGAVPVLRPVE